MFDKYSVAITGCQTDKVLEDLLKISLPDQPKNLDLMSRSGMRARCQGPRRLMRARCQGPRRRRAPYPPDPAALHRPLSQQR